MSLFASTTHFRARTGILLAISNLASSIRRWGAHALIHFLYQESHADKIDRPAAAAGIVQDVLIEVNDGESNKQGRGRRKSYRYAYALRRLEACARKRSYDNGPIGDASVARATFSACASCAMWHKATLRQGIDMEPMNLSMGMSNDYSEGIGEGATMVRIAGYSVPTMRVSPLD